jgi:hypothetical protein
LNITPEKKLESEKLGGSSRTLSKQTSHNKELSIAILALRKGEEDEIF